ncbi:hypothetical protein AGMMS49992_11740 [Clostridia bacterium]|nr:hypothetical protein AGMMS49992_11740 [Clostridia bacterium]
MYRTITDVGGVREYLSGAKVVAFDFETAPDDAWIDDPKAALDPHKSHIVGVSFSVAAGDAVYVPIRHRFICINADECAVYEILAGLAADTTVVKVAHNIAFESMFLYAQGIVLQPPVYDTIAAAQLMNNGENAFRNLSECGLKTLAPLILGIELATYDETTGGRPFGELDPNDPATINYACADSDCAFQLRDVLNRWFRTFIPNHRRIVEDIESPTAVFCGIMKYNGLLVDMEKMVDMGKHCEAERGRLRDEITFIIGDVKIGKSATTQAFKKYLYDDLKLPTVKVTAKMKDAADDETMILLTEHCEKNRPDLVPLFKAVQDYRRWGKIKSTYIDGYTEHINPVTGRIHADLMPLTTNTGRIASRNPNLQNMPRFDGDEAGVRNFFLASEGNVLMSLDFSQIELRVGAFYCRDEKMLETYRVNGDIHALTTSVIYSIPLDEAKDKDAPLYKTRRTIAKNTNFGVFYGLFARGLRKTLHFKAGLPTSFVECGTIIKNLKDGYPRLAKWQSKVKLNTAKTGQSDTWLGRRRYLPDIDSDDWGKKSYSERCALNTPIQGTAADILKLAMGRMLGGLPSRPWLKPLLTIHDENVFEVPVDRIPEAASFIKRCMEIQPFPEFDVPIVAEVAVGNRFGEMKDYHNNMED